MKPKALKGKPKLSWQQKQAEARKKAEAEQQEKMRAQVGEAQHVPVPEQPRYEEPLAELHRAVKQLNYAAQRAYNSGLVFTFAGMQESLHQGHVTPPLVILAITIGEPSINPRY